jgi:hypothetical protein
VILKLEKSGYSKQFCRRMLLQNGKEVNFKVFLGALRRWPMSAIKTVIPFLALVSFCALDMIVFKEFRLAESSEISPSEVQSYKL